MRIVYKIILYYANGLSVQFIMIFIHLTILLIYSSELMNWSELKSGLACFCIERVYCRDAKLLTQWMSVNQVEQCWEVEYTVNKTLLCCCKAEEWMPELMSQNFFWSMLKVSMHWIQILKEINVLDLFFFLDNEQN